MNTPRISTPLNAAFVLLGMGGKGGRCVARFAELCAVNPVFGREMLSRTHFVLIDTDVGDLYKTANRIKTATSKLPGTRVPPVERLSIGADIDSFERVVRRDERDHAWSDLPENEAIFDGVWTSKSVDGKPKAFAAPRAPGRVVDGASQCPMISSYLAMRSVGQFDEKMKAIQRRIQEQYGAEGAKARVAIVTSLAGGTGRGSWWLAASRARRCFGGVSDVSGVFLDSSCFTEFLKNESDRKIPLRMHTNSLTGFAELAMWLRLGMFATDHQQVADAPDLLFPPLDRPSDKDPHASILDTRLLANPGDPANADGYAHRYPLRRAFVVTGETDGAPLASEDAAAGLLLGLCGLKKTISVFSNNTDWAGSGMTSVASVPLTELKQGADFRLRAGVLEDSLLASHEAAQVEADMLQDLRRIIEVPAAADFGGYDSFARRFLDESGGFRAAGGDASIMSRAIRRMAERAPTSELQSSLEDQSAPDDVFVPDALFNSSAELSAEAYRSALSEWIQDEIRSFRADGEDDQPASGGDLRLEDWFFDQALSRSRHGDGDKLFSLHSLERALEACVTAITGARDRAQKVMRELNAAGRATPETQSTGRREDFRRQIEAAAGRNPLWPMWPSSRYSENEIADLLSRARFEFVRSNVAELLKQHVRRLEMLMRDLGRAQARVHEANGVVRGIVRTLHEDASPLLGFDAAGRAVSQAGACRIVPADATARWSWLVERLGELQSHRKDRCLTIPVLLKDKDELGKRDVFENAARSVRPIISEIAFEHVRRLGFRPLEEHQDGGGLVTAEEREQEELRNFEQGVRNRLNGLSISGGDAVAEHKFDMGFSLERVLRSWASEIATITKEPMGPTVRDPADRDCRSVFGFGLDRANELAKLENGGRLLYALAARIADDNDEPVRPVPSDAGSSLQDKVSILVPGRLLATVEEAAIEAQADEESMRSQEYQRASKVFDSIDSEHLLFASTWTMISNESFREDKNGRGGWSVWTAFDKHRDPVLRSKYLSTVDDPAGSSVFNAPEGAVGLGYTCPVFLRNPRLARHLWRPWAASTQLPVLRRKGFAVLYAMLGVAEGVDAKGASATTVNEFLSELAKLRLSNENPDLHWTMPILSYDPAAEGEKANQLSFRLERPPFEAIESAGVIDFRMPNAARQAAMRKALGRGGPVEFVRDLNAGNLDGIIEGLHAEHAVLMRLIRQRPEVEALVTDPLKRTVRKYLGDVVEMRKTRVGKSNAQTQQLQLEFYDGLLKLLEDLDKSGKSLLDPFVGS